MMPYEVVNEFKIHTLFLSPFFSGSIMNLIFGFWSYLGRAGVLEFQWGTIKTMVDFFWKNLFINVLYIVMAYFLNIIWPGKPGSSPFFIDAHGLWPILFSLITEQALENPDGEAKLMCFPIIVRKKYYPFALWILFSLISGYPGFDDLAGIIVGFVHYKYLNTYYFEWINDRRMARWSTFCLFKFMTSHPNYVPGQASATDIEAPRSSASTAPSSQPQSGGSGAFNAFSGKGVAIGGTVEETIPAPTNGQGYAELVDVSNGDDSSNPSQHQ